MIIDGPLVVPHKHKLTTWKKGFPLKLCKCGFVSGIRPKVGSNTIDVGASGAGDIIRWSATTAAIAAGDIGMSALTSESKNGRPSAFIESEARDLAGRQKMAGGSLSRIIKVQQNAGLTTLSNVGIAAAPTTIGTPTVLNVTSGEGQHIQYLSGAVANDEGGIVMPTFDQIQRIRNPVIDVAMRTAAVITVVRTWSGVFSGDPMGSDTPAVHLMGFRYSPATDATAFWRCVTDNGSGIPTVTTTTTAFVGTTSYRLRIVCDADGSTVRFYINGILVATHTTTLPTNTQNLGFVHKVRTLETVAKAIRFGRLYILQKASA